MPEEHEFMICCFNDFPRCMTSQNYSSGVGRKQSECPCEVARQAVAHLLPKVTKKDTA